MSERTHSFQVTTSIPLSKLEDALQEIGAGSCSINLIGLSSDLDRKIVEISCNRSLQEKDIAAILK